MGRGAVRLAGMGLGLALCACSSLGEGPGTWKPLPMEHLRLAPVTLQGPPPKTPVRKTCNHVPEAIQKRLGNLLADRLGEVKLLPPGAPAKPRTGTLQVGIFACRRENLQARDGSVGSRPSPYLTLDLHIKLLSPQGKVLMERLYETERRVPGSSPSPGILLWHYRPASWVAHQFRKGRYRAMADPAKEGVSALKQTPGTR
ncbi:MAG TPA: hypothetical protein VKA48_01345 [Gammaproteobacteria bacterium]|nr:hypothetical protein [Gammaproteobacteria bacterium]